MWPRPLFEFLGTPVNGYALAYAAGVVAALAMFLWLGRQRGMSWPAMVDLLPLAAAAGLAGGYLWYGLGHYGRAMQGADLPVLQRLVGGGRASMGCLVLGLMTALLYVRFHPATRGDWRSISDAIAPVAALYQVFARVGCFASGCCYGRPAFDLPWAVVFDDPSSACAYRGMPVHPVQLYEAGACLALSAALTWAFFRPSLRGRLLGIYLAVYGAVRFGLEFLRGDWRPSLGPLSVNQWVCLAMLAFGVAWLRWRKAERPVEVRSCPATAA